LRLVFRGSNREITDVEMQLERVESNVADSNRSADFARRDSLKTPPQAGGYAEPEAENNGERNPNDGHQANRKSAPGECHALAPVNVVMAGGFGRKFSSRAGLLCR